MKAAKIYDSVMLDCINFTMKTKDLMDLGASLWDLQALFPNIPPKVVKAKLSGMVKRKIIWGCACGCRGDFRPRNS